MRYIPLILIVLLAGCVKPSANSLNSISGHYYLHANVEGTGHTSRGDFPFHHTIDWDLNVTSSRVMEHGRQIKWTYDGTTLMLYDNDNGTENDVNCGSMQINGILTLKIPIKLKQDSGPVSGDLQMTVNTQNCGTVQSDMTVTGTFSKA